MRRAGEWERLGPDTGIVLSLAAAPSRPQTIYAGLMNGRVFRSEDGGETWTPASHGIDGRWDTAYDPAVTPQDPNGVYLLSNSRLHKSTDAGVTWKLYAPAPPDVSVDRLVIDPRDRALYVGTGADGVMRWRP